MSVLSTAETGASPDIPRRRLRVAAPGGGQDDGGPAASALGAGATGESDPPATDDGRPPLAATELHATELRVREIRVVREASVRTFPAGGSNPPAAQARMASQAGAAAQILAATRTQRPAQARPAAAQAPGARARAAASTQTAAGPGAAASRTRVTHGRATYTRAAHVRATRTRTVSQRPGAVRLTRRGRLVVAGFVMLVVIAAATLLWMILAGSVQATPAGGRGGLAPRSPYQGMIQIAVQPGQTLWSIAAAAEPSANTWTVVQQITEVNALNGPAVRAGELLWVPRG